MTDLELLQLSSQDMQDAGRDLAAGRTSRFSNDDLKRALMLQQAADFDTRFPQGGGKFSPWKILGPILGGAASLFAPPLLGALGGAAAPAAAVAAGPTLTMDALAPEFSHALASSIVPSVVQSSIPAAIPAAASGGGGMGFLSNLFRGAGSALAGAANSIGGAVNNIGGGIGNAASTLMDLFRGQGPNPILSQGGNLPSLTMGTMGHTPPVGQAAFPAGGGGMGGGWGGQTQPFQTQPMPGGGMGGGFNQQWNPLSGIGGFLSSLFGGGGGSPPPNFPGMGNQDSTALAMQALQDPLEARLASMAGLPGGAGYNQLTTQQLQNSPYRQGMPGFGPAPQNFWQRFVNNIQNRLMPQMTPQQPNMAPPQGLMPQTGFSAGESGGGENKNFFGLEDPNAALGGLGVLGIGELLNKPINMPDFQSIPQVKELSDWSHTANHPLDPNVQASIQRTLDIQNEQQLRNLRDVYKNARPGTDYTTDSAYQRDLERLNRSMAMQGADAMAGSQLASNQMHLGNLGNLSQLAVGQNLGQAGIEAQRQRARNQMFGNIGGMLGYKGIFGNKGPGIFEPWNKNQGQGVIP